MKGYNHGLFHEVLKRFDGPPMYNGDSPANVAYNAILDKWPQINYRSRISLVNTPFLRLATPEPYSWTQDMPQYVRKLGWIAWLWRLWYEIMVRPDGPDDIVLKERGWESKPLTNRVRYETIEFQSFGINYGDFWGQQRVYNPYIVVAYHPATDTIYIKEK